VTFVRIYRAVPLRPRLLFALGLLLLACTPAAEPRPAPTPIAEPPPAPTLLAVTAPATADPGLQVTVIDSSWGSIGVVPFDRPAPYWVLVLVDVQTERDVAGLTLTGVELFDADNTRLGQADREFGLRITPPGAPLFADTHTPFHGTLTAGHRVRLRVRARMQDLFADRLTTPPTFHRVTLRTDAGAIIRIAGKLGSQWPTG
jgi:hypothetical protein